MSDTLDLEERLRRLESGGRDHHGLPPMGETLPLKDRPLSPQAEAKIAHDRLRWEQEQARRAAQAAAVRKTAEAEARFWADPVALSEALAKIDADLVTERERIATLAIRPEGCGKAKNDERVRNLSLAEGAERNLLARRERITDALAAIARRQANAPRIQALEAEADEVRARLAPIHEQARPFGARLAEIDREMRELNS